MPQDRTLIAASSNLRVEHVRFHAVPPQWSRVYEAPVRRLVLPATGAMQLRSGDDSLLVDPLTAFRLGHGMAYQLRPEISTPRESVVVSEQQGGALDAPQAWLLAPAALYQLRLHWRALARGQAGATGALLADSLRAALPLRSGAAVSRGVLRARHFLAVHAAGPATLFDAADAACISPFHLARGFRRQVGLGLHQYRQRLRMAAALARLEHGERDLAGLAQDLGYSSQSHFGDVFRREVGVPPSRARERLTSAGI